MKDGRKVFTLLPVGRAADFPSLGSEVAPMTCSSRGCSQRDPLVHLGLDRRACSFHLLSWNLRTLVKSMEDVQGPCKDHMGPLWSGTPIKALGM